MMKTNKSFLIFTLFFVAFASHVQAATTLDFYTYNGFLPVSQAFQKAALIFSNTDFQDILDAVMYISLPLAGIIYFLKALTTPEKGGLQHIMWALPLLLLFGLYLALFRTPDSSIVVYDPVLNRTVTVGNLPEGVVMLAGYLNRFEREMVDIIDTAGVPGRDFQDGAGGIGINLIRDVQQSSVKIDRHIQSTLADYIDTCVMFEITRPGTTLDVADIMRNTNDFMPELQKAAAPAIFTKVYTDADPTGTTTSCQATYTTIAGYFASANYDDPVMLAACTKNGFDVANASELTKCKSLISSSITNVLGFPGVTHQTFTKQAIIAKMFYDVMQNGDTIQGISATASRSVTTSGVGMGIAANEWLPIIRAIMLAISIGLIPFLVVFIPSPLGWKAISTIAGLMVFNSVWGVTDAVCHGAAMDYSAQVYGDARMSGLAFETMLNFPDLNMKTVALFGQVRSGGIMLASVITMMLVKFGGSAMAHMAGGLVGGIQGGGKEGGNIATPEGHGDKLAAQEKAMKTSQVHASPQYSVTSAANADANTRMEQIGTGSAHESMGSAQAHGENKKNTEIGTVAGMTATNAALGTTNTAAGEATGSVGQAKKVGDAQERLANGGVENVAHLAAVDAQQGMGVTEGKERSAEELGDSVQNVASDSSFVDTAQKGAKAQEEINAGNVGERAAIDAAIPIGASIAAMKMFNNSENAAAFGKAAKGMDFNSTKGRLEASKDLQQSLADDGQSVSLGESQQLLAKAQALSMGGGAAAYLANNPNSGADNMISAGKVSQGLKVGETKQQEANANAQGASIEQYGGQGAQQQHGVAVTEGMQEEMRKMGASNAQIPSLGSNAIISRGTDGEMTGYQATEQGSASTQSYDTDAVNNTATRKEVVQTDDGPVVQQSTGQFEQEHYDGLMASSPGSNDYGDSTFQAAQINQKGGTTTDTVGLDSSGQLAHKKESATTGGQVVDSTTSRGDTTGINEGRVNIRGGASVDGTTSMAVGKASGGTVEAVTSEVAQWFGASEEEAQSIGQKYGDMAEDYSKLAVGTTLNATSELRQLGIGGKGGNSPDQSGGASARGTTNQDMNDWKDYFKHTGDIAE